MTISRLKCFCFVLFSSHDFLSRFTWPLPQKLHKSVASLAFFLKTKLKQLIDSQNSCHLIVFQLSNQLRVKASRLFCVSVKSLWFTITKWQCFLSSDRDNTEANRKGLTCTPRRTRWNQSETSRPNLYGQGQSGTVCAVCVQKKLCSLHLTEVMVF